MPELQIAASAGPAAATAAAALTATADPAAAGAFAALLQQQLADPAALVATLPGLPAATAGDPAQTPALEALMPLLLGAKGLLPNAAEAGASTRTAADDEDAPAPDFLLALPAVPTLPAVAEAPAIGGGAAAAGPPPPAAAAENATAILAAAPEVAGTPVAAGEGTEGFETLLGQRLPQGEAAALAPAHAAAAHAATAPPPVPAEAPRIATPVGAPGWGQELGERVVWLAGRLENRAELVLTPPQLGRIEISLTVSGDQASAVFTSANPAVREALESALPRLREVLADAGIQLGQAQVGSEAPGQSARGGENGDNPARNAHDAAAGGETGVIAAPLAAGGANPWVSTGRGLVDVFA